MSEGDGGTYQPVDQRQIEAMRMAPGPAGFMGNMLDVVTRVQDKAALAASQAAGGTMMIDPDQVEKVAQSFEDEARALMDRQLDIHEMAAYGVSASDPVSTQSGQAYSQVVAGDGQAYLDNYVKLAKVLLKAAEDLRDSAKQTRLDDENAADGMRGGELA
ncbi:hypothetical protein F1721_18905 [Saccharopolyspora hirsuta]|uniref:PE domain-containing protein n=1 Tax=Saccharopolyspora hirsuta TaxID=1837 RepID=A0A5M7BR95_SACHI|nr:hypothetical protein [Saccharopolyspora hirsuta]KAA5831893.1 hypothetical protein F1721_18905 [Saccharopolyspora hirsuta]